MWRAPISKAAAETIPIQPSCIGQFPCTFGMLFYFFLRILLLDYARKMRYALVCKCEHCSKLLKLTEGKGRIELSEVSHNLDRLVLLSILDEFQVHLY